MAVYGEDLFRPSELFGAKVEIAAREKGVDLEVRGQVRRPSWVICPPKLIRGAGC